jgi:hypothetical protein
MSWKEAFEKNLLEVLFDPNQPRDESGRWTTTGMSKSGVSGLPEYVDLDSEFNTAKERGGFSMKVTDTDTSIRGEEIYTISVGIDDAPHFKKSEKGHMYDPKYAEEIEEKHDDFSYKYVKPKDNINDKTLLLDKGQQEQPGYIYRGMSYDEYVSSKERGFLQTKGDYNLGPDQEGLTYYTTDISSAASYSSSFAPWQYKPTYKKPAIVVKIKDPGTSVHVEGVGEHERGVPGKVPFKNVVSTYEGKVYAYSPGTHEYRYDPYIKKTKRGSSQSYTPWIYWDEKEGK